MKHAVFGKQYRSLSSSLCNVAVTYIKILCYRTISSGKFMSWATVQIIVTGFGKKIVFQPVCYLVADHVQKLH